MKNSIACGEVIDVLLAGTVSSGDAVKVGNLVGIASTSGVSGDTIAVALCGAYTVPKATGAAWVQGDKLYWDATAGNFTKTSTSNTLCGAAYAAAQSGDTTGQILLTNGV